MHRIVFKIDPVPASRPRVTKYGVFYQEKYAEFRKTVGKMLLQSKRTLYSVPLITDVTFYVKLPKSYSNKKKEMLHGKHCATTFDLDNLEKALYDTMNGHTYEDDRLIVEHTTRKIWDKNEGRIEITIKTL